MNWKSIKQYNLPPYTDILMRIDMASFETPEYAVGWVDDENSIVVHEGPIIGGFICDRRAIPNKEIKSIHYINPDEIKL